MVIDEGRIVHDGSLDDVEVAALRDISVLEPDIEDVVARLYARQGTP